MKSSDCERQNRDFLGIHKHERKIFEYYGRHSKQQSVFAGFDQLQVLRWHDIGHAHFSFILGPVGTSLSPLLS